MPNKPKHIGSTTAIELSKTEWWKDKSARDIARIGLGITELCLPFEVLHKAVEEALGRPVFSHEFASDALILELYDEKDPPTLQEIFDLIPPSKLIICQVNPTSLS